VYELTNASIVFHSRLTYSRLWSCDGNRSVKQGRPGHRRFRCHRQGHRLPVGCRRRRRRGRVSRQQGVVEQVTTRLGPISVLIANAVQWPAFDADEIDGLTTALAVNAVGPMALIDAALPAMRAAGWGRIVAVSTDIVAQPMPGPLGYATAKGALEAAARVLAVREARHGILTNVVRPGFTLTDKALNAPFLGQEAVAAESQKTPTGRICTPEDIASAITYLASAANGHVNGQVLSLAGGRELVR
jgi:NAD(P)-dependent dehydrogenase (short-subunit alcohol dehydrogenase family)